MSKPLVVVEQPDEVGEGGGEFALFPLTKPEWMLHAASYEVRGLVKQKYLFKNRPKPSKQKKKPAAVAGATAESNAKRSKK